MTATTSSLSLRICTSCGANVPTKAQTDFCELCKAPNNDDPLLVEPLPDDLQIVQIRAEFKCRACGFMAPLDGLIQEGALSCRQCGQSQHFDLGDWATILDAIHATADMAGPFGVLRDQGEEITWQRLEKYRNTCIMRPNTEVGNSILTVSVAPGHPLCEDCHLPLEISISGKRTNTRCPRCRHEHHYDLPADMRPRKDSIKGVISLAHSLHVEQLTAPVEGEVRRLDCPNCGGSLALPEGQSKIICEYCGATALAPVIRVSPRMDAMVKAEPWWLIFVGASPERQAMVRKHQQAEQSRKFTARRRREEREQGEQKQAEQRRRTKRSLLTIFALLAVGLIVLFILLPTG